MKYQDVYKSIAVELDGYYTKRDEFDKLCDQFYIGDLSEWKTILKNRNPKGKIYDPLTLLSIINGFRGNNRVRHINNLCKLLKINVECKNNEEFFGVSIIDHNHRTLPGSKDSTEYDKCVDLCWKILHTATIFVNDPNDNSNKTDFISFFDQLNEIETRSWDKLTHVLSYCYPDVFIALSTPNRTILKLNDYLDKSVFNEIKDLALFRIDGERYLLLTNSLIKNQSFSVSEISGIGYLLKQYIDDLDNNEQTDNYKQKNDIVRYDCLKNKTLNRFKRNPKLKNKVFERDGYTCQCCGKNQTFFNKSGKQYMEAHHLIPYSKRLDFFNEGKNIDVEENVFCVCPECHRAFHFGNEETIKRNVDYIFNKISENCFKDKFGVSKSKIKKMY